MEQIRDAIGRYQELIAGETFRDLSWAENLQENMRQHHFIQSGRLIAPVLRPQFISLTQLQSLTRSSERLAAILHRTQAAVVGSPALLNRLRLLPAEKMLAAIPVRKASLSTACRFDARIANGSLCIGGFDACRPEGFAHSELLADLFLNLPIMRAFGQGRYKIGKLANSSRLVSALLDTWKEFGGINTPHVAILESESEGSNGFSEGQLLASLLVEHGCQARVVTPENYQYSAGRLRSGPFEIDVVFRRLRIGDLLAHFDLSHPVLSAYRDSAVCLINNFQSEVLGCRAFFEFLTDGTFGHLLPSGDRKLLTAIVPWTRIITQRKTHYKDDAIDLLPFILQNRDRLVLRPNNNSDSGRVFAGVDTSAAEWERALRTALHSSYVVQERTCFDRQSVPFFLHGDLKMKDAEIAVHPQLSHGKLNGATAVIEACISSSTTCSAAAPVFLLENG